MEERRRQYRHALSLRVEFDGGIGQGTTRDISAHGVYFETDVSTAPYRTIEFSLRLEVVAVTPTAIHCHGHVIRVDPIPTGFGVAVRIDEIDFRPCWETRATNH